MHAVSRSYSGRGARELFSLLEERSGEVEDLLRSVTGLVSYAAFRTDDGGITVTVCRDKAGTDESSKVAAEWVAENAANILSSPPDIAQGSVLIHLT